MLPTLLPPGRSPTAVVVAVLSVAVGCLPAAEAGPPPPITRLDPVAADRAGVAVALDLVQAGGHPLLEVEPAVSGAPVPLLAVAPDGRSAALAAAGRGQAGPLTIARDDGSQLQVELPGPVGAAFHPSAAWLAVVDLAGSLWRVDTISGAAELLADGPFAAEVSVLADGDVLALRLSSVEAPTWSVPVRVDPAGGPDEPVLKSSEAGGLVYRATSLLDGDLVVIRHRRGGGIEVARVAGGQARLVAALDAGSDVEVSPDGARLAWLVDGRLRVGAIADLDRWWAVPAGGGARFSPDGGLLLAHDGQRFLVLDQTGRVLHEAGPAACWLGDGRGCRP